MRYYIYAHVDDVYRIIAYIDCKMYDNEFVACRGAIQIARVAFTCKCDVVDSRNRTCNVAFVRHNNALIFAAIGYEHLCRVETRQKARRNSSVKDYDVTTNTFTWK
jgi:hypothetical protein